MNQELLQAAGHQAACGPHSQALEAGPAEARWQRPAQPGVAAQIQLLEGGHDGGQLPACRKRRAGQQVGV